MKYQHHADSVEKLSVKLREDPEVLALVLAGSVAKGVEKPDSDLDVFVVLADEKHARLAAECRLSVCDYENCAYESGYFDIKHLTLGQLRAVAERGSEPARDAWTKARCVFSRVTEIGELIPKIAVFREEERAEKMLSFYSAFTLNVNYYWHESGGNAYLRARSAADIVLFAYRMMLQEAGVLFSCHKSLEAQIAALPEKPDGILAKSGRLLTEQSNAAKEDSELTVKAFVKYAPPADFNVVLSRYAEDNEWWWYKTRPIITEW